jgi:hypothetical protein
MTPHPTRSRTPRRLVVVVALLLGALWPAAVASAADAGWTLNPAANGFGADRKDYAYTVGPGGRLEDGVVVVNEGTETLDLALRASDGAALPAGRVGAWVHLRQNTVSVLPGASVTVPFVVTPPKDATPGDHLGGIVAARVGGAAGATAGAGVPIRLRVSGPLKPGLAVQDVHINYSGTANPLGTGDATITYTIRNTGNATLGARPAVSASGPAGVWTRRAGRLADAPSLLPGATWKGTAPLRDVAPALRLSAKVVVTPLLADASGSIAPLAATSGTAHAFAIPWALLLVLVALGGAVGVVVRRRVVVPRGAKGAVA